ncbi:MAG TPA: Spy/CpxP family protein refolding chaperone [Candidatus Saccharicenans sp.]|nr:Spy/CpxP family protein refolding chaperone [Candidatus Saccharicenans sp.]HRD01957.1 Spy/CpxP family protein refolding chaperone [Candidatus Saccharicenans sp.]
MNRKKIIGLLGFVLMIVFIYSTVSAQAVHPAKTKRMGVHSRILKDALQLTPEQEKKLEEFRQARLEEAKVHREKMTQMRNELRKLMADPKADEQKVNNLIDQMARLRADRMKASYKNRKAWEKIFTPEQLKKLEEYRQDFKLRREARRDRPEGRGGFMMRHGGFGLRNY